MHQRLNKRRRRDHNFSSRQSDASATKRRASFCQTLPKSYHSRLRSGKLMARPSGKRHSPLPPLPLRNHSLSLLQLWTVHLRTTPTQVPFALTTPTAQAKGLRTQRLLYVQQVRNKNIRFLLRVQVRKSLIARGVHKKYTNVQESK